MRKLLVSAGALLLCAAPLRAQQAITPTETPVAAAPAEAVAPPPAAALNPTPEHVKQLVREQEQRHNGGQAPIGSKDWWYLVAAIAIGVIIAAVLL
jgi:hypothetical protein